MQESSTGVGSSVRPTECSVLPRKFSKDIGQGSIAGVGELVKIVRQETRKKEEKNCHYEKNKK